MAEEKNVFKNDNGFIYALRETGEYKRDKGELVPIFVNDVYIQVNVYNHKEQPSDVTRRRAELAEKLTKIMNDNIDELAEYLFHRPA